MESKVYDCTYSEYVEKKEAGTLTEELPKIEKTEASVANF